MSSFIELNTLVLILLTFLEVLLVIIPAFIDSKIEKTTFVKELKNMGFRKNNPSLKDIFIKIIVGLIIGLFFYLVSGYILYFFKNIIVETLMGELFVSRASEGAIRLTPNRPKIVELVILIIIQFLIVALCEEGFFRGFILKKSESKLSISSAILFSSLIFALYHVPPYIVPISTILTFFGYYFTFGILLGIIFKYFNYSLIPPIIAHGFFNTLILLL
ncbi:MAG: CPBP family intramembrane metalloprotease [Candidatus Lokiarchaeota archaeon]|nr:CPBP family intramembrane metalloprotease [Candidatus Lokiarchaeota archaeon]